MKHYYINNIQPCLSLIGLILLSIGTPTLAQNYCDNGSDTDAYLWIEEISINSFAHHSGTNNGSGGYHDYIYQGYKDYSEMEVILESGDNLFNIDIINNINSLDVFWSVWIDLNQDFEFSEDERLLSDTDLGVADFNLDLSGLQHESEIVTRMRVSANYMTVPAPCGMTILGEVEDYTVIILAPEPVEQVTLRVPEEYPSIQSAVDAAVSNERILVNDGTFYEHIVIDKPLLLETVNGADFTKIIGQINRNTFQVNSPDVTIKGFGFTGAYGWRYAGIYFSPGSHRGHAVDNSCLLIPGVQRNDVGVFIRESNDIVVEGLNCVADETGFGGIWLEDSIGSHFFNSTLKSQAWYGIYISNSSEVLIENNTMNHNVRSGLYVNNSNQITIKHNVCSENIEPDFYNFNGIGIVINKSADISVEANQCNDNSNRGIMVYDSSDVELLGNELSENDIGVFSGLTDGLMLDNNHFIGNTGAYMRSGLNTIVKNNVFSSTSVGLHLQSSHNGQFFDNHFLYRASSITISQSDNNLFFKNVIKPGIQHQSNCKVNLYNADDNRIYMNDFLFDHNSGLCSSFSTTYWSSENPINYIYENELYQSHLGNFYQTDNQLDLDGDGVVDSNVVFNQGDSIDEYPLSKEFINFEWLD